MLVLIATHSLLIIFGAGYASFVFRKKYAVVLVSLGIGVMAGMSFTADILRDFNANDLHHVAQNQGVYVDVRPNLLGINVVATAYPCEIPLELRWDSDDYPWLYVKNSDIIATPEVLEELCT